MVSSNLSNQIISSSNSFHPPSIIVNKGIENVIKTLSNSINEISSSNDYSNDVKKVILTGPFASMVYDKFQTYSLVPVIYSKNNDFQGNGSYVIAFNNLSDIKTYGYKV